MTTTVQQFIKDKLPVASVTLSDSLVTASKRLIEHDFSQLPVVNSDNKPVGIITSDLILKALNNYGTSLKGIRIKHAMFKKPQVFRQDIDLLDLFDDMDGPYALIVDDEGRLVQIITSYDTAKYFRQRANDILLVENIESTLKDYVQLAFSSRPDGETKLNQAIQNMTNSTLALRPKFDKGLRNYLGKLPKDEKIAPNADLINEIFEKHFDDKQPPATFDDLTLAQYISLFLHKDHWSLLEGVLELNKDALTNILDSVRQTRNDLSHFRDIARDQGYQLRDCYDLLVSHQAEILRVFASSEGEAENEITTDEVINEVSEHAIDDEPSPGESRYAPLAIWLESQSPEKELVNPSFSKIEALIGGKLPDSAYKNRSWWSNDTVGHVQSKQWLDVGWRVATVNMTDQVVRFIRIKERENAYIYFYSELINDPDFNREPAFWDINKRPDGRNWHWLRSIYKDKQELAALNYCFGRGGVFRAELYIDTGDGELNKQLFDKLIAQREEIEAALGHELTWQRLNSKRASRVAYVFTGHITDSAEDLAELRRKAAQSMVNLAKEMEPRVKAIGEELF